MNDEAFMGWDHELDLSGSRGLLHGEVKSMCRQAGKRVRELGLTRSFKTRRRAENAAPPAPAGPEATT